jgi:hypothetical protein
MKKLNILLIGLFWAVLSGCSSQEMMDEAAEKFMPAEVLVEARALAALVVAKDTAGLWPHLNDALKTDTFEAQIANVWSYVPDGAVLDVSLAGANYYTYTSDGDETVDYTLHYQYQLEQGWLLVRIVLREVAETRSLINIHVTPLEGDLREIHKLDLMAAPPKQWLWFCLLILIPTFVVVTFVSAFRMRKSLKRPKRWLFFILIGIGQVAMNWTTGEMGYGIATFGLLGAGIVTSGPHAPWIIKLYFPLGAALFWFFKKTGKLALKDNKTEEGMLPDGDPE